VTWGAAAGGWRPGAGGRQAAEQRPERAAGGQRVGGRWWAGSERDLGKEWWVADGWRSGVEWVPRRVAKGVALGFAFDPRPKRGVVTGLNGAGLKTG